MVPGWRGPQPVAVQTSNICRAAPPANDKPLREIGHSHPFNKKNMRLVLFDIPRKDGSDPLNFSPNTFKTR